MTSLVTDLNIGARVKSTRQGFERIETVDLLDVPGVGDEILYNALIDPLVPQIGDAHPTNADLQVINVEATSPGGNNRVRIEIFYAVPSLGDLAGRAINDIVSIRYEAGVITETTLKDKDGTDMSVSYLGQGFGNTTGREIIAEAEIQIPSLQLFVDRVQATIPATERSTYLAHVNDASWVVFGDTFAARSMLCIGIRARDITGTGNFLVSYAFQHKDSLWDFEARVKIGGQIPVDANFGVDGGLLTARVFQEANFDNLSFPSASP